MKKKGLVYLIIALVAIALIALVLVLINNNNEKKVEKIANTVVGLSDYMDTKVDYKDTKYQKIFDSNSKESTIYGFNINGKKYKIGVFVETFKESLGSDDVKYNIFINDKLIDDNLYCGTDCLGNVYLTEDVIYYETFGSDGTPSIHFKDLDGNTIEDKKYFDDEKNLFMEIGTNAKVENNKFTFEVKYDGGYGDFSENEAIRDDDIVYGVYELEYLGNHKFSDYKLVSSKTKKEYNN